MKETELSPVQIQALRGVNETPAEKPDEFATLQNLWPDMTGRHVRIPGKKLLEKRTGPVMGIFQFWTAYGYSSRLSQVTGGAGGGIISDPELPPDVAFKIPIVDYPLNCRPIRPFSNKLKVQYLDKRSDFIHIVLKWTRCAGTDLDTRLSLIDHNIVVVPPLVKFTGAVKEAIVGMFADGPVLNFDYPFVQPMLTKTILWYGGDAVHGQEEFVIDLATLRKVAGDIAFTAKFQLKAYWFSYLGDGNVIAQFFPKDNRAGKGGFFRNGTGFKFFTCVNFPAKTWRASITTNTATPLLNTGDHICYLYVNFFPFAQRAKDRIWIDDT